MTHNPDARPPRLGPGWYEFEDLELLNYPIWVNGRAEISIDRMGEWYVSHIDLDDGPWFPVPETSELFTWIKQTLEAKRWHDIQEHALYWGENY
jgi:hypothetical protein